MKDERRLRDENVASDLLPSRDSTGVRWNAAIEGASTMVSAGAFKIRVYSSKQNMK